MPKRLKIMLYIFLAAAIITVVYLMFGRSPNFEAWESDNETTEITTWEDSTLDVNQNTIDLDTNENTFEDDVMKDLEWFFGDSNWYENVEWEYWFTNPENE